MTIARRRQLADSDGVSARLLAGFDDPSFGREQWNELLARGPTDVVFLTWEWQSAWWEAFGRGELRLVLAERAGAAVALAPLFWDGGMFFLVGSGGSDYLDLVGDISGGEVLDALIGTALSSVPECLGLRFYHVPDSSDTGKRLAASAERLCLTFYDEGWLVAPALDIAADPQRAFECTRKKSLVRHEAYFARTGELDVTDFREPRDILQELPAFFEQHEARWAVTPYPSLFTEPAQRAFYRRLTEVAGAAGWLRFMRIEWEGKPIAYHFGFLYHGSFLWYKPSFDIELARRSPGEVLLRRLLLAALHEGAHVFDFGLGDEAFKQRFATTVQTVRTWALYPGSDA